MIAQWNFPLRYFAQRKPPLPDGRGGSAMDYSGILKPQALQNLTDVS